MSVENKMLETMETLLELGMRLSVEQAYAIDEDELLARFKEAIREPVEGNSDGMFGLMFVIGTLGVVLSTKYRKSEKELMELIKDANGDFIKELRND